MKTMSHSKTLIIAFVFLLIITTSFLQAQEVTEHFTDETAGASTFTNTSYTFNLTGGRFVIAHFATYGYTGTGIDDDYVDNYGNYPGSAGVLGSITSLTNWFKVYDLYIFPGVTGDFVSNAGNVVIRGKHSGTTQFTHTVLSASINTAGHITNGWTYVNLTSYSSYEIDQLEFEVTGSLRYLGIDAFRHLTTGILPVKLSFFTASTLANNIILNWQTATEVNNYGFEVERTASKNISWEKITVVPGHGNSNSPKSYSFTDVPNGGTEFKYRLKQIDVDGQYEYSPEVEVKLELPAEFSVQQNFPNPFNPTTKIAFSIPSNNDVEIKVFNVLGMEVATLLNEHRQVGTHTIEFNASNLASGIYFYKIVSGNFSAIKKMLLLR